MALNYAQLKTEIQTDPTGIGYAAMGGDTLAMADALNLVRAGISIQRDIAQAYEIFDLIVPSEWASLSAQEKNRIQLILSLGLVNMKGTNTRQSFQDCFGAGTTTRANLVAYQNRQGSRAEQLFGAGTFLSYQDVGKALGN